MFTLTTSGGSYTAGTTVQLIANPAANHHFVSWNDGNTSNPRYITVTGNATYIATFAVDQYQIDVLSGNDAMGTTSGSGTYDYGSAVQIRAIPYANYEFVNWSDGNTDNPRDITVLGNMTFVANFQPQTGINDNDLSAISVYSQGNVTGGGTYVSGAEVSLQATANAGYRFTGWNDGNTDNPRTFTAMENASYTAYFADLGTNELHYDNGAYKTGMGAGGTIYWAVRFPASVLTSYSTLSSVRLWDAYAGSYVVRICQGGTTAPGTQLASQTFTLSGTYGWYDATFSAPITIDPTQSLWVVLYNTGVDYPASASTYAGNADGSWVSLDGNNWNSICDYGYNLSWMIRPVLSSGSTPQTYTVTAVSANTSMGTVTGGGTYDAGTTIQLTATAYQGYEFVTWQDGNTSNPRTITVTENATYTAYFQAVSTNCTVTSFPWTESFEDGWNCWTTIDADGDGNYWGRTSNLPAHDGSYTLYSYSYDSNNDLAIDAENYLISPQITLPATGNYQLTFYARCASSSYPDSLWVKMSTTGNTNVSAFNTVLMTKTAIAASYQQYTVSLSGHNGQSFYLAFTLLLLPVVRHVRIRNSC